MYILTKCSHGWKAALIGAPSTSPIERRRFHTPNRSDRFHRSHRSLFFADLHHLYKFPRELIYRIWIICTRFSTWWSVVYAWSIPYIPTHWLICTICVGQADHDLSERVKQFSTSIFVHRDHLWRVASLGGSVTRFFNHKSRSWGFTKTRLMGGFHLPATMPSTNQQQPSFGVRQTHVGMCWHKTTCNT